MAQKPPGRTNRDSVVVKRWLEIAILENRSGEQVQIDLRKPQFLDYVHVTTTYCLKENGRQSYRDDQGSTSRESFYVAVRGRATMFRS